MLRGGERMGCNCGQSQRELVCSDAKVNNKNIGINASTINRARGANICVCEVYVHKVILR